MFVTIMIIIAVAIAALWLLVLHVLAPSAEGSKPPLRVPPPPP